MKAFVNVRGFSLIEMLITLAVMSIGMVVMAGYMSYVTNQQRILMQNAEAVSVDNNLTNLMVTSSQHCTGNIKRAGINFAAGSPPSAPINLACQPPPLGPGGCPLQDLYYFDSNGNVLAPDIITGPQTDGTGLNIASIQLWNVHGPAGGPYSGDVVISYAGTAPPGAFRVKGVSFGASTSGGRDTLDSCVQVKTSCATGYTYVGTSGSTTGGDQLCISTTAQPAADFGHAAAVCGSAGGFVAHVCSPAEWEEACVWDAGPGSVTTHGPQTNASTCQCSQHSQGHWVPFPPPGHFVAPVCTAWTDPSTGATCTPTYQYVMTSAHDNGPKLHMGLPPEWVNLEHLYDNGNGGQWNGTIMGGPGPNMTAAGQCIGWSQYQTYVTNNYPYRCCYRP